MDIINQKKAELKKILSEGTHISAYVGSDMIAECGYVLYNENEDAYALESEYGSDLYSLFSARYYETRTSQFFKFYKKSIIQNCKPSEGFNALYELQKMDKLKSVISRDIYILAKRVGCKNTVELSGNIFDNKCQKCGKKYPLNYIIRSKSVPLCKTCEVRIRPNVMLFGETRDNYLMTKAANSIEKADVLLFLGCHLNDDGDREMLRYYKGNNLVVIHRDPQIIDERADLCIKGSPNEILSEVVKTL